MTLNEIKAAVRAGKTVYWCNEGYKVAQDSKGQWLIIYGLMANCIGLTWKDEVTLNGKEEDFYISE